MGEVRGRTQAPSPSPVPGLPSPPKLVFSQSRRGHTPHVSRQYCRRWASVKGSKGNMSVLLLLVKVRLISVQACGPMLLSHGFARDPTRPCRPCPPGSPRLGRPSRCHSRWGRHSCGIACRCRSRTRSPRSCTPALWSRTWLLRPLRSQSAGPGEPSFCQPQATCQLPEAGDALVLTEQPLAAHLGKRHSLSGSSGGPRRPSPLLAGTTPALTGLAGRWPIKSVG